MLDLSDFSQAVARIYDASMDVTRWPDALSLLTTIFGGTGAQIAAASGLDSLSFLVIWGFPDELIAKHMPQYVALSST